MAGQHIPADHSRGDANTIGGYAAVHGRPAAFEGSDGLSYSVEIVAAPTGRNESPCGAYLLFVKWSRIGAMTPEGHIESDFLAESDDEADARAIVGAMTLSEVRAQLESLLAPRTSSSRPWYDVMRDDPTENA